MLPSVLRSFFEGQPKNHKMTDFERGSVSMARSSEAMLNLIEKGTWTMEMARAWLTAVIKNEPKSYLEIREMNADLLEKRNNSLKSMEYEDEKADRIP